MGRLSIFKVGLFTLSLATTPAWATAIYTYTYTGNTYTNLHSLATTSLYNTNMRVEATVDLHAALGSNVPLTVVSPIAVTVSDGVHLITLEDAISTIVQFGTDDQSRISQWEVYVFDPDERVGDSVVPGIPYYARIAWTRYAIPGAWSEDFAERAEHTYDASYQYVPVAREFAYNFERPGDWRSSLVTVPEPTSLALLGIGLAGLVIARRRKAKRLTG